MAKRDKRHTVRADFRKNRAPRTRQTDLTRKYQSEGDEAESLPREERISGKGELVRKRTIRAVSGDADTRRLSVDEAACCAGRVLSVQGLTSTVEGADGQTYRCATRGLLKTLSTEQRHVVAAGDLVTFRTTGAAEGVIERIEPRHGVLARTSRGRQHVIVANVDQLVIVSSAAEPYLKPNLIDRYLVNAEKGHVRPLICINKIDLVEPASLQPLVGVYSRMGYEVLLTSTRDGRGIERLRRRLARGESVLSGQSGVGKSSLLNTIEPGLELRVGRVSSENEKGRHTTTSAQLCKLSSGGFVVDTPGLRQFELWDIVREEYTGLFRDVRPFAGHCRYPDCTHEHEDGCAVKGAVADGWLDTRRYESLLQLLAGDAS